MNSVMMMLLVIGIVFAAGYFVLRSNLVRKNGNRRYTKWRHNEIDTSDDQMVAVAALLMHYGVVQDHSYKPEKLREKVKSVEEIGAAFKSVDFDGYYDYDEETLKRLFNSGHPCAIRAAIGEGEQAYWLPVMYLDDDGGVVWNPYSQECFIAQFDDIKRICCFTIH